MALCKTVTTVHGFTAENAYIRVEDTRIIGKDMIDAAARFYMSTDKPAFQEKRVSLPYDLGGPNPIKQVYEYLKTLPELADAVDC